MVAESSNRSRCRTRVLIVGRRFWPHGGFDSAMRLKSLAVGLYERDLHVEVVSPQYSTHSASEFRFREISVHRPVPAPKSDWTISRYTRQLTQWLRRKLDSFDVVLVDSIREEAIAAIEAARSSTCSVVVSHAGYGQLSDSSWWPRTRSSQRCAAIGRMADRVITRSANCEKRLLAHQFDPKRFVRIPVGIPNAVANQSNDPARKAKSLSLVNSDLSISDRSVVLLCHARMSKDSGIDQLVSVARELVGKFNELKIWLIGDGPSRDRIYSRLRGDGIRASIAMPGSFCDIDDLMNLADLYVQPGTDGLEHFLPAALASGLPIVSIDCPSTRQVFEGSGHLSKDGVLWFPPGNEVELRRSVGRVLNDLPAARDRSVKLHRSMLRERSMSNEIDEYVRLIDGLVRTRGDRPKQRNDDRRTDDRGTDGKNPQSRDHDHGGSSSTVDNPDSQGRATG